MSLASDRRNENRWNRKSTYFDHSYCNIVIWNWIENLLHSRQKCESPCSLFELVRIGIITLQTTLTTCVVYFAYIVFHLYVYV